MVWDLDNTLIGSSQLLWSAFNMISEKYTGVKMTPAEIVRLYGPPEGDVIEKIVGAKRKNQALKEFYEYYQINHEVMVKIFSQVFDLIRVLHSRGVKQALFTSKGRKSADITLDKLGMTDLFDMVVCGDEIPRPKPYPDGVEKILSCFSIKPEDVIYFGDSPLDIQSAHRAGVRGALVLWDSIHLDEPNDMKPDYIFTTFDQLKEWIDQNYTEKTIDGERGRKKGIRGW